MSYIIVSAVSFGLGALFSFTVGLFVLCAVDDTPKWE
jgi:hypothetical protein